MVVVIVVGGVLLPRCRVAMDTGRAGKDHLAAACGTNSGFFFFSFNNYFTISKPAADRLRGGEDRLGSSRGRRIYSKSEWWSEGGRDGGVNWRSWSASDGFTGPGAGGEDQGKGQRRRTEDGALGRGYISSLQSGFIRITRLQSERKRPMIAQITLKNACPSGCGVFFGSRPVCKRRP